MPEGARMNPIIPLRELLRAWGPTSVGHPRGYVPLKARVAMVLYFLHRTAWCTCQQCLSHIMGKSRAQITTMLQPLVRDGLLVWALHHPSKGYSFVKHDGARRRMYAITEKAEPWAADLLARARATVELARFTTDLVNTYSSTTSTNVDTLEGV